MPSWPEGQEHRAPTRGQQTNPCQPVPPHLSKHCKVFGFAPQQNNSLSVSSRQPSSFPPLQIQSEQIHTQVSMTFTGRANISMFLWLPKAAACPAQLCCQGTWWEQLAASSRKTSPQTPPSQRQSRADVSLEGTIGVQVCGTSIK